MWCTENVTKLIFTIDFLPALQHFIYTLFKKRAIQMVKRYDRCSMTKGKKDGWKWGIAEKERRNTRRTAVAGTRQRRGKLVGHLKFFHPQQGGRLNWHLLDHRQLVRRIEVVVSSSSSRFLNLKFGIRSKGFFFDAFTMLVTLLPFTGKVSRESCKL